MGDSTLQFKSDQSLQRAGRNLGGTEGAAEEVQRAFAAAEQAKDQFVQTFRQMVEQMENDMPSAPRLRGELQAVLARAHSATTADEWRAVVADAATLKAVYEREHEMDEERLNGGRGGRNRERRADVSVASQDN